MNTKPLPRHAFSIEVAGKLQKGTYWIAGKILTVTTGKGSKSKQVGSTEPEELAKRLLIELVNTGKA